ncbi:hypothetical protein OPQ81_005422 [Rhizoctonia solani]|nr:hypothetical protein OPQ81_005422 [Rhizoctonia solani]
MSSENESAPSSAPVWNTGPKQVKVELVVTGEMYSVDVDIAKRMGIIQEGVKFESPFGLGGCSSQDFERALIFCASDRSCSEPPSKELAHIIRETATPNIVPPSASPEPAPEPAPEASTSTILKGFAEISLPDDDEDGEEEDGSYVPSESEESDSSDEYSNTDMTDIGTANINAEREEYNAREQEKQSLGL